TRLQGDWSSDVLFRSQQSSTTVASGSVISESPAAGTSVAKGSAVNLVVSSGAPPPTPVAVPNVVGQTQVSATSAITSAGLTVGKIGRASCRERVLVWL